VVHTRAQIRRDLRADFDLIGRASGALTKPTAGFVGCVFANLCTANANTIGRALLSIKEKLYHSKYRELLFYFIMRTRSI
jgi:hypothetical protein